MTTDKNELLSQIHDQYIAVAYLAQAIKEVAEQNIELLKNRDVILETGLLNVKGEYTARWMEQLGNMLNGVDAVTDSDDWMRPIFERAHQLFPVER